MDHEFTSIATAGQMNGRSRPMLHASDKPGSNLCFGGAKQNRLFITAGQSLYAVYLESQRAHLT